VRARPGPVALVSVLLLVATACTSNKAGPSASNGPDASQAPSATAAAAPATTHAGHEAAAPSAPARTPTERAATFEQLLGRHALLTSRLMRSVIMDLPGLRTATGSSLQANTGELATQITSAYGAQSAGNFTRLWRRYLNDCFLYANAVANGNTGSKATAEKALEADASAYGRWAASSSKGRLPAPAAAARFRTYTTGMTGQLDQYAAKRYDRAYQGARTSYETMFTMGAGLAKGSLGAKQAAALDQPAEQLRSAFAMLLGEHMELVVDAQRATFAGSPEFTAAAGALNTNTRALTSAIGGIAGPAKAEAFEHDWAEHIEGLVAYTAAVARKDDQARDKAAEEIDEYAHDVAAFFAGLVDQRIKAGTLAGAVTAHDEHLIEHVEAYASRDYEHAETVEAEGYQQMLGVAAVLVDAVAASVSGKLPVGGSQTGGGGTAR
jgi:hypothetical protein